MSMEMELFSHFAFFFALSLMNPPPPHSARFIQLLLCFSGFYVKDGSLSKRRYKAWAGWVWVFWSCRLLISYFKHHGFLFLLTFACTYLSRFFFFFGLPLTFFLLSLCCSSKSCPFHVQSTVPRPGLRNALDKLRCLQLYLLNAAGRGMVSLTLLSYLCQFKGYGFCGTC